jgi:hypothetical protein
MSSKQVFTLKSRSMAHTCNIKFMDRAYHGDKMYVNIYDFFPIVNLQLVDALSYFQLNYFSMSYYCFLIIYMNNVIVYATPS